MEDFNKILLSQMRDIRGLEGISIWPLAGGWWFVVFILLTITFIAVKKIIAIKKYKKSWKYLIQQQLENIANTMDPAKAKENISYINDVLKRLSLQFYGRKDSASLTGKQWLSWLTNRDPKNFNWLKKGEILIEYPYMPEEKIKASAEQISNLAKAARSWLKL